MKNTYVDDEEHMYTMKDTNIQNEEWILLDDKLSSGELVYVYHPRNRRIKLTHKWAGPAKVTKCSHPVYEVKRKTKKGDITQWTIRNKLKRAPANAVWSEEGEKEEHVGLQVPEETTQPYVSSDSEDEETNDVPMPDVNVREAYNLRDRGRWGRYYGVDAYVAMLV